MPCPYDARDNVTAATTPEEGTTMRVGSGAHTYEWVDNWAKIPDTELAREGWAHHGIVATEAGEIIACHQGEAKILVFDKDGNLLRSWDSGLVDAHGIAADDDGNLYVAEWLIGGRITKLVKR